MPLLQVIVASTRPGRVGRTVAEWFAAEAEGHAGFDVELVDLAEVDLPLFDEPKHPRLQQYEHDHTRRWSDTISRGDAFAFVMPEYNFDGADPLHPRPGAGREPRGQRPDAQRRSRRPERAGRGHLRRRPRNLVT